MKRLVLLLALALAGCPQPPKDQAIEYRASVTTAQAQIGRIERTLVTTGTVRAEESAKAVSEAAGKLAVAHNPRTGRRWAIGDDVKKGETLAIIAPVELATQARLDARRSALVAARADHERYKKLHDQGLVSSLQMAEQDTALANAEAELRAAELQESKSRLVAPISGLITTVTTSPDGELITERQTLAEIMEFGELIVDLDLGSSDILDVSPGQRVRVSVPGTSLVAEGQVARVAPAIDPKTRTFRVEVSMGNAERRIRPGMFVRAEIVLEAREKALLVPAGAVVERDGGPVAFVVEAQHAAQRRLTLGLGNDESIEITDGVREGEPVVISGQETLADGVAVSVRP